MENKFKLDLIVKSNEQITNLNEISKVIPRHEISFFRSVNISISEDIQDYERVDEYWQEQTTKFCSRKKFEKKKNDETNVYNEELTIYKLSGALVYPDKLFVSNFEGEIPRNTVIGIKSFRSKQLSQGRSYNELADVTLGRAPLKIKPQNFCFSCDRVILLSSAIQRNYYHWMVECFPKIEHFQSLLDEGPDLKILIGSNVPSFVFNSLKLFGIPENRIINLAKITAYPEVIFSSRLSFSNQTISPLVRNFYENFSHYLFKKIICPLNLPKRIYISRANTKMRKVINEDKLICQLKQLGFETLHCEHLSLPEQAMFFHNAEFVIGAHGAGLANLVFCKPKTKVLELNHSEFDQGITSYAALAELFSLEYQQQISRAEQSQTSQAGANNNFVVDISMIEQLTMEMLQKNKYLELKN